MPWICGWKAQCFYYPLPIRTLHYGSLLYEFVWLSRATAFFKRALLRRTSIVESKKLELKPAAFSPVPASRESSLRGTVQLEAARMVGLNTRLSSLQLWRTALFCTAPQPRWPRARPRGGCCPMCQRGSSCQESQQKSFENNGLTKGSALRTRTMRWPIWEAFKGTI